MRAVQVSIHAPLAGRDLARVKTTKSSSLFQSTRPLRGATAAANVIERLTAEFQSTRPLRGATEAGNGILRIHRVSIHAPLAGRDAPSCRQSWAA